MKVLVGDLGGTKTLLALTEVDAAGAHIELRSEARYASAAYGDFGTLLRSFLADHPDAQPTRACFAVAGPVTTGGTGAHLTNLPWQLDSIALSAVLNNIPVVLINDFAGIGYGLAALTASDVEVFQTGVPDDRGTRVVIGAGTGLGIGLLVYAAGRYHYVDSEGGHAGFAPADAWEIELYRALRLELPQLAWEHVLSGPGLVRIYRWLCRQLDQAPCALDTGDDDAAAISAAAHSGKDRAAQQALDGFARLYGSAAGNLALTALARGGVYIAGGIAPKLLDSARRAHFLDAFLAKDRMQAVLCTMPVRMVTRPGVGLLGAALHAAQF